MKAKIRQLGLGILGNFTSRLGYHLVSDSQFKKYTNTSDFKDEFTKITEQHGLLRANDFTAYSTYNAVSYIIKNGIDGDFVECGVASGKHPVVIALTLLSLGVNDRDIYLYDTFKGMTPPTEHDIKMYVDGYTSQISKEKWDKLQVGDRNSWCYVALEQVKRNLELTGYPSEHIHYVQGSVMDTLPNNNHSRISLLRLDTDFYDSTKHELCHLYDLVSKNGIVTFDDYGAWLGQKKAVDEFFESRQLTPLLHRSNFKERVLVKT